MACGSLVALQGALLVALWRNMAQSLCLLVFTCCDSAFTVLIHWGAAHGRVWDYHSAVAEAARPGSAGLSAAPYHRRECVAKRICLLHGWPAFSNWLRMALVSGQV